MRTLAAITLLMTLLAACGQTGPLYLPGEAPASQPADVQPPEDKTAPPGD